MDNEILKELTEVRNEIKEIRAEIKVIDKKTDMLIYKVDYIEHRLETYQNIFYFGIAFIALLVAFVPVLWNWAKNIFNDKPKITRAELEPIIKEIISSSQLKHVDGAK